MMKLRSVMIMSFLSISPMSHSTDWNRIAQLINNCTPAPSVHDVKAEFKEQSDQGPLLIIEIYYPNENYFPAAIIKTSGILGIDYSGPITFKCAMGEACIIKGYGKMTKSGLRFENRVEQDSYNFAECNVNTHLRVAEVYQSTTGPN